MSLEHRHRNHLDEHPSKKHLQLFYLFVEINLREASHCPRQGTSFALLNPWGIRNHSPISLSPTVTQPTWKLSGKHIYWMHLLRSSLCGPAVVGYHPGLRYIRKYTPGIPRYKFDCKLLIQAYDHPVQEPTSSVPKPSCPPSPNGPNCIMFICQITRVDLPIGISGRNTSNSRCCLWSQKRGWRKGRYVQ